METKHARSDSKEPLYLQLTEEVRRQIQSGALKPGDRLPSIAQLRESHGFSKLTIERAHQILEQENIVVRQQGRGTFVREPVNKPQFVVAVSPRLMPDEHNPYWFQLLKGISARARQNNVEVIFSSHDYNTIWERANGMIITGDNLSDFGRPPSGFPFVSLVAHVDGADAVVSDDRSGVFQLTQHLIGLGHRRIAVLSAYKPGSIIVDARYQGHRDALQANGIAYNPQYVRFHEPSLSPENMNLPYVEAGREGMRKWLQEDWATLGCTAILAYNDGMAIGAIQALREVGLEVPRDVSVTGFDGTPAFDHFHASLTTIKVPLHEIGQAGLDLLIRRLTGEKNVPSQITIPVTMKLGESTGPLV